MVSLTQVREYRKYHHLVLGVSLALGCSLGNSINLMLVFPCTHQYRML